MLIRALSIVWVPFLVVVATACGPSPPSPQQSSASSSTRAQRATIYATGDGTAAWHIDGDQFWSGAPGEITVAPLSEAPASVRYWRTPEAQCLTLDEVVNFGVPHVLRDGARFQCEGARFEVLECDWPEACLNARIEAFWRTGVAPEYGALPVIYLYNVCRGVQTITYSLDRPPRSDIGETLELRQGLGLLAQPDSQACRDDPGAGFYGTPRTP